MVDAIVSVVLENLLNLAKDKVVLQLGLKKELGKIKDTFHAVRSLLEDAERKQIQEESVRRWLRKLEEAAYEMDDLLEEWMVKSHRTLPPAAGRGSLVRNSLLSPISSIKLIKLRFKYGSKLCVIKEKLDQIAKDKIRYQLHDIKMVERADRSTYSYVDEESVKGRDGDKKILVNKLTGDNLDCDQRVSVISIVGMGGVGKTTLAQLVYNDQRVKDHFQQHLWVCVSNDFNVSEIIRKIVVDGGGNCSGVEEPNARAKKMVEMLHGKRFLLILDDVWNEDHNKWEQLMDNIRNCGANGSKIVITTRKEQVAKIVGNEQNKHLLSELSRDDCWSIFQRIALSERTNVEEGLEEIGKKIVSKCKGLPLAIKTMASMLRIDEGTKESWENILHSEIWTLPQYESDIVPALLLSYFDLPSHLKQCFGYCSMYPKDSEMDKRELVRMWVAQGYVVVKDGDRMEVEDIGEKYFKELLDRSLFQEPQEDKYEKRNVISCKMHDLVHDVAKYVTRRECESFDVPSFDVPGTRVVESSSSHSRNNNILHCWFRWVSVYKQDDFQFANWLGSGRNLRTLALHGGPDFLHLDLKIGRLRSIRVLSLCDCSISDDKLEALGELIHIRYLDLSECTNIKSLPISIKKLELLRYLKLKSTKISELPEWITNLRHLQSIDLSCCFKLEQLPKEMCQLVSLRHLDLWGTGKLKILPAMIGRLSRLQTLSTFTVAVREEEGGSSCSNIGELGDLNFLRGSLDIINLENVGGRADARMAKLEDKRFLRQLELKWTRDEEVLNGGDRDEEVLEGLCPPPDLVRLHIEGYRGGRFPGWMDQQGEVTNFSKSLISSSTTTTSAAGTSTPSASIFSKLQELGLYFCHNVSQLPRGLGLLPCLKTLIIWKLRVKKVGSRELLGGGDHHHAMPVPAAGFFPHLEELRIELMDDLEAWDDPPLMLLSSPKVDKVDDVNDPQVAAPIMPRLRSLTLRFCPKLQALPPIFTTSLRELCLLHSPLINMRFLPPQGIERIELFGMPTRRLLMESPGLRTTLKKLLIRNDDDLTELPVDDLLSLASLRELCIWYCPNLETLPEEISRLRELEVLHIFGCPKLEGKCREGGLLWPNIRHIPTIEVSEYHFRPLRF